MACSGVLVFIARSEGRGRHRVIVPILHGNATMTPLCLIQLESIPMLHRSCTRTFAECILRISIQFTTHPVYHSLSARFTAIFDLLMTSVMSHCHQ
jgi:hypothetical protein